MASGPEDLRSSLLKSRIARLPHLPAIAPSQWASSSTSTSAVEQQQEGEGEDQLGSLSLPPPPLRSNGMRSLESRQLDQLYSPLSAEDCFAEALEVEVVDRGVCLTESNSTQDADASHNAPSKSLFRVYYTPPRRRSMPKKMTLPSEQPTLENLQAPSVVDEEGEDELNADTVFFLHHGAGYSGLSYALVAKAITKLSRGRAGVLTFDCRGHGKTTHHTTGDSEALSMHNLTNDCVEILSKVFPPTKPQPTLVLVGHSMGGSVVVSLCHALTEASKTGASVPRIAGVAVLDVVEGSAMAALAGMKTIVSAIPKGFHTVEEAIRWHVDSGTIVNAESARRSVPSLLLHNSTVKQEDDGDDRDSHSTEEVDAVEELQSDSPPSEPYVSSQQQYAYTWRANLLATEPYWSSWFQGLSQSFLSVKCARLLLLAGTDRLDKDLMIGQMQGKYQLVVFADVGHSLQEDAPERTAQTLIDFWTRNEKLNIAPLRGGLRKVGDP